MDYTGLPEDLHGGIKRYYENRLEPGSFLAAVLENDLVNSLGRADPINRKRIFEIVQWIYNELPADCWGSRKKVEEWLNGGK